MRLIDADALKEKFTGRGDDELDGYDFQEFLDDHVIPVIENAPTIEVESIKRGKWVLNDRHIYECSECGLIPTQEEKDYWHYCPNCGAKMDTP